MACAPFCSIESVFIFINIGFAMYSGALLATSVRLAWDPSTYAWFRYMCAVQYRACVAFTLGAGAALAALVYLAAAAAAGRASSHPASRNCLRMYAVGVCVLCVSEVSFGAWLAASLAAWWRDAPQAELARRGADLLHDLKPLLLKVERYHEYTEPVYEMIEEMEQAAPNNVYVIIVFMLVGIALQISAMIVSRRLWVSCGAGSARSLCKEAEPSARKTPDAGPGWRKHNQRMYTIIDKIF